MALCGGAQLLALQTAYREVSGSSLTQGTLGRLHTFFLYLLRAFVGHPTRPSVVDHLCSSSVENLSWVMYTEVLVVDLDKCS